MKLAEIELEVLTPMFSYGDSNAEFRITELKSLMRNTFRELYYFKDLNEMKEKEKNLFGGMEGKSPIIFRIKNIDLKIKKEYLLPHKKCGEMNCLEGGSKIIFNISVSNTLNMEFYIVLLMQSSIIGSMGKRSRKGFGSFKINSIKIEGINENKYMPLVEENPINILKNEADCKIHKIRKCEMESSNEVKYSIGFSDLDYPYIKSIKIVELKEDKNHLSLINKISQLTHDRLYEDKNKKSFIKDISNNNKIDKNTLGNCKRPINRFASPVCVSFWENNKSKYMIIKELNYNYILKQLSHTGEIAEKANEDYVNKYIKELINIGGKVKDK